MGQSKTKDFGAVIREALQAARTDTRELALTTRIQLRYLDALVAEDWQAVPRGVIGRGFVRVLARELRLPSEEFLQLYRAARGDDDAEPERTLPEADWKVDLHAVRRGRPALWAAFGLVALALAIWKLVPWGATPSRPASKVPATETAAAPPASRPAAAQGVARLDSAAPVPAVAPMAAGPDFAGPGKLRIEAVQKVWIRIVPTGGQPHEEVIKPGERLAYDVGKGVEVKLGNGGAARLFWNDQLLGIPSKGTQVVTLVLPRDLPKFKP